MFSDIAKFAFVRAAADMSRFITGGVNQSRVAALTGLSRGEVKATLLRAASGYDPRLTSTPSRLEKVLQGWRDDPRFSNARGPKQLPITGSRCSFVNLVRKYGGDVPHRAVLDELLRVGAVRETKKRWIILRPSHRWRLGSPNSRLSLVLRALTDGVRLASNMRIEKLPSIHRLTLPTRSGLDLELMRERCDSSVQSMLAGLSESLGAGITLPRRHKRPTKSVTVTVLVVENKKLDPQAANPTARGTIRARNARRLTPTYEGG
jgi:hypothetical protein